MEQWNNGTMGQWNNGGGKGRAHFKGGGPAVGGPVFGWSLGQIDNGPSPPYDEHGRRRRKFFGFGGRMCTKTEFENREGVLLLISTLLKKHGF